MVEKKPSSKWAKVLEDAGLLDDVDDAWEMDSSTSKTSDLKISVGPKSEPTPADAQAVDLAPPEKIVVESETTRPREDETARIVSGAREGMRRNSHADITTEVKYSSTNDAIVDEQKSLQNNASSPFEPPNEAPAKSNTSSPFDTDESPLANSFRSPFATTSQHETVVNAEPDTLRRPSNASFPPASRVDTNPGEFARHSMGLDAEDTYDEQPRFAPGIGEYTPPGDPKEKAGLDDMPSDSLTEAVKYLQDNDDQDDKFVDVKGQRISIASFESVPPKSDMGHIDDGPVSVAPIDIGPEPPTKTEMLRKYDLSDFSGALEIAGQLLESNPDNIDARHVKTNCEQQLVKMFESKIGNLGRVPNLKVSNHELMWRNLDPAAGFILSRIDGMSTYEDVIDVSGMPRFDVCKILVDLIKEELID